MNQQPINSERLNKTISPEQFTQIVGAILEGKYSWACVLLLRFVGYNPLHYIPYRTYNRLVKESCRSKPGRQTISLSQGNQRNRPHEKAPQRLPRKINDLAYLEVVAERHLSKQARGGYREHCLERKSQKPSLVENLLLWSKSQKHSIFN